MSTMVALTAPLLIKCKHL